MAGSAAPGAATGDLWLDPAIRNWVLLPIMAVMILVGLLRHNLTSLMASQPKTDAKAIRETQALQRARYVRANGHYLHRAAFTARKEYLKEQIEAGAFLRNPNAASGGPPQMDKAQMDTMMDGLKKNMFMLIPQSIIMTWVTYFFSGFVVLRLPFALTLRFKSMLQRGIDTSEMDVSWVSSLSWYFLLLFGLQSIFVLFLGDANAADSTQDMRAMGAMAAPGQPVDMNKLFVAAKEDLDILHHRWDLANVEQRLLSAGGARPRAPRPSGPAKRD